MSFYETNFGPSNGFPYQKLDLVSYNLLYAKQDGAYPSHN